MENFDTFVDVKFFEFHTIKKTLVDSIRNPAPKCCRVIVFLDFPNSDGIDSRWKRTVDSASKRPHWGPAPNDSRQSTRIVVTREATRVLLD